MTDFRVVIRIDENDKDMRQLGRSQDHELRLRPSYGPEEWPESGR